MTNNEFIEQIAPIVQRIAPEFGICVVSPIIAQACLESGYGTSYKASHHNYFGLKYREGRLDCHSGTFVDGSSEQLEDGTYIPITDQWYSFKSMEDGVRGYFQYTNISRYANLKGVVDPHKYLELIRADGYATSLKYVDNVYRTLTSNNLERFDVEEVSSMKYNDKNKPLICMQTNSTCYRGTQPMEVLGVLFHSTGANNPNLRRYVQPSDGVSDEAQMIALLGKNTNKNDWNHIERQAGLNAWIGKLADGSVTTVQTMPWNYRPWGCGKGSRGSCNNGWIQFEICEDNLADSNYFNQVYNEAIELTAYLCKLHNLDPYGKVVVDGVAIPVLTCHADAHKLGFGSNHGDINHWFPKYGKSMQTVRDDVAKLLQSNGVSSEDDDKVVPTVPVTPVVKEMYRVRLSWEDAKSQLGAYEVLDNAKKACKVGYTVYNSSGIAVYSNKPVEEPKPSPNTMYYVQAGAFSVKSNALTRINTLKSKGFDAILKQSGNLYLVQVGAFSNSGYANELMSKVKRVGIEACVTTNSGVDVAVSTAQASTQPTKPSKTVEQLAKEVWQGKWENGADRKKRLTEAGYDYNAVQAMVNKLYG